MSVTDIRIVPATLRHVDAIDLRAGDTAEIAALGRDRRAALGESLAHALWADAYLIDGEVAAIVGLSTDSLLGGRLVAWMLTGRPVDRHRKSFLRLTRGRVREMLKHHHTLTCSVHAEYAKAIRWLRWLGFDLAPARPTGPNGALFHEATLRRRGPVSIQDSTIAALEAADNLPALLAEYADEAAIDGLPAPASRIETYRHLEQVGALHTISAVRDGRLVGFITLVAPVMPHYSVPLAVSESFFVARADRCGGAGLKLLRAAEDKARALGSPGLLVSAPYRGDLFRVLPRVGYRETNRAFFKKVGT
jgi:GNAT superfamily N-acetyltransferase